MKRMSNNPDARESSEKAVRNLTTRLQQHEAALLAVPGVNGCGVGLAADGSGHPVIQVFVSDGRRVAEVQAAARNILGAARVEVVVMPLPSAD
jgi:hypothetical protein